MPVLRFSRKAEKDFIDILTYTIDNWGLPQAERYTDDLERVCRLIAQFPLMGRTYASSRPTWRRLEHASHVILYTRSDSGVTIQRIMHNSQMF